MGNYNIADPCINLWYHVIMAAWDDEDLQYFLSPVFEGHLSLLPENLEIPHDADVWRRRARELWT